VCRARLASVNRAFKQFCDGHAARLRQHTELLVPFESWDAYSRGAVRWVAWHAVALRAVHLRFEVRRDAARVHVLGTLQHSAAYFWCALTTQRLLQCVVTPLRCPAHSHVDFLLSIVCPSVRRSCSVVRNAVYGGLLSAVILQVPWLCAEPAHLRPLHGEPPAASTDASRALCGIPGGRQGATRAQAVAGRPGRHAGECLPYVPNPITESCGICMLECVAHVDVLRREVECSSSADSESLASWCRTLKWGCLLRVL